MVLRRARFFDNYIIPLARKLKECGVFVVSSDDCVAITFENRREWAMTGEELVRLMLATKPERGNSSFIHEATNCC
jgi:hypothetical protein